MVSEGDSSQENSAYLALIIEKKINENKGVMPVYERKTLARNLGIMLTAAKARKVTKSAIVVESGIPHNVDAPVNALNAFCILANNKSKRTAEPRLCAHPQNYLKLALATAKLVGMARARAISQLTEGSNLFSATAKIDEEQFPPVQAVWELLRAELAVIVERHQLKQFFRDAYSVWASYDENILSPGVWEQDRILAPSTSYWPWAYLCAVSRASEPAVLTLKESDTVVSGTVHAIEQVYLTLGWDPGGWVVGYLEYLPGLAIQSYQRGDSKPLYDFHCSGETFTRGRIGDVSFEIADGASIQIPGSGSGDWPFRLRSRIRFERLTLQQLAGALLESSFFPTPDPSLVPGIDTSAVMSPPDSLLAVMEAQLLGRKMSWPKKDGLCFLEELEQNILRLTGSFREWRQVQQKSAEQDYFARLAAANTELERLKAESSAIATPDRSA
ncbi:hypothetical protein [Pseudomonas sp. 24 E 13]|uniref:hypothetical protein n=1 Tax=unclassified Pseudomonas TaxID=196821 RepID=UPI0008125E19|nr:MULTISPECIES: hypothetical protein [unclassified Pseudomonas]MCL9800741.1 hypothetical protein [Pseudomonas sp. AKS31]CRM76392.1 hypothetical protein [Pseudomonas sp. 24 E 13]